MLAQRAVSVGRDARAATHPLGERQAPLYRAQLVAASRQAGAAAGGVT